MIDKTADMTSMNDSQLPILNSILDGIRIQAMTVKHTSKLPTVDSVSEGQIIIYDSAAVAGVDDGTKRIYVVTGKKNLAYITLT